VSEPRPASALRVARVRAGYGVHELAKLAGISRCALWRYEFGIRQPKAATRRDLSRVLGVSPSKLFGKVGK
jgi:transcriptional regulator with XRE-family HTH domain